MCNDMVELKNAKARIIELEGELKSTRKDYMDEIVALARHNGDLKQEIEELKRKLTSHGGRRVRRMSGQLHHHRRHRFGSK